VDNVVDKLVDDALAALRTPDVSSASRPGRQLQGGGGTGPRVCGHPAAWFDAVCIVVVRRRHVCVFAIMSGRVRRALEEVGEGVDRAAG